MNQPLTLPMSRSKLEVVVIPVSDVDRAKEFYARLDGGLDADFTAGNDWRGVQFTPPGSGCSVIFGKNVTTAAPGSAQGLYLAVSDIEAARKDLLRRGVEVSEVFHGSQRAHWHGRALLVWTPPGQRSRTLRIPVTTRSPHSMIRTATAGCCRRSQPGCLGEGSAILTLRR